MGLLLRTIEKEHATDANPGWVRAIPATLIQSHLGYLPDTAPTKAGPAEAILLCYP